MITRLYYLFLGLWFVMVLGCSVQEKAVGPTDQSADDIDYSIIYLLHADADYLYHSGDGKPLEADEETLKKAQAVAEKASRGEVFIFHQRPEQKILWLFPKKDRHLYHYKNGELISKVSYSPEDGRTFATESKFYEAHSMAADSDKSLKRILLFYGHEISMRNQSGYHRSRPEIHLGSHPFAKGIAQFNGSDSKLLDMVVLSTCNNGTPDMVNHLRDETEYVLASPQNLHLSHVDSDSLSVLERNAQISTADLGGKMADQTFDRLSKSIRTEITLALYNMDEVRNYVPDLSRRIAERWPEREQRPAMNDNTDCTNILSDEKLDTTGVTVWFKPPAFGRRATDKSHSGWGCVDLRGDID